MTRNPLRDDLLKAVSALDGEFGKQWISENWEAVSLYFEEQMKTGDGAAIFSILQWSFVLDKPVPRWCRVAFIDRWWEAIDKNSLDASFGLPRGKGKRSRHRKLEQMRLKAYYRIRELHEGEGKAISPELFEQVGQEMGMSKTKCSDIYYELHHRYQLFRAETGADHFREFLKISGNTSRP